MKVYEALEDFQIVTYKKITINKGQRIPEDFFSKNFADPKVQLDRLIAGKKIAEAKKEAKTETKKEEAKK